MMIPILVMLGFFVLLVIAPILNGWALTKLWAWFIVPTFGVPQLHLAAAIGLAMTVAYLTHQNIKGAQRTKEENYWLIASVVTRPLLVVLFALIVKQWM